MYTKNQVGTQSTTFDLRLYIEAVVAPVGHAVDEATKYHSQKWPIAQLVVMQIGGGLGLL